MEPKCTGAYFWKLVNATLLGLTNLLIIEAIYLTVKRKHLLDARSSWLPVRDLVLCHSFIPIQARLALRNNLFFWNTELTHVDGDVLQRLWREYHRFLVSLDGQVGVGR